MIDEFLKRLVYWFGGIAEYWPSIKTLEYHFTIKNSDIGYYHFTIPFDKIECIDDANFLSQLFSDYLATIWEDSRQNEKCKI